MNETKTLVETKKKLDELRAAALPLIEWLNNNFNPHVTAIVTPTSVEVLSGEMVIPKIMDFVKD